MEIGLPIWNGDDRSYSFPLLKTKYALESLAYYEVSTEKLDLPATASITQEIIKEILEKTVKYFTNPLTLEKVLRHLRHSVKSSKLPLSSGWFTFQWRPVVFVVKAGDFCLSWEITAFKETQPVIPAEFTASTTPRAQSPVPEQPLVRSIQIHDTLVPVGDLPLSDLPPLSFGTEEIDTDPVREETKRRIREARLKVQLAKLKAERMEQKYYERYGQSAEETDDSSEFSSESEEEKLPFDHSR